MNIIKRNILANFAGNLWTALMSLAFIPLYIHFMGIEAYGLVGIFGTVQAMFSLLDMGLSPTMNREMARRSVLPDGAQDMRNLVRTLEVIYWGIAFIIGIVVIFTAPLIAYHWVRSEQLPSSTIQQAVIIMGIAMAFQWPLSFYSGGLMGLQRQVLLNGITVTMATLRGTGAVLILWLVSPSILAFFTWQIIISLLNTITVTYCLWYSLPPGKTKASFQKELLRDIWRFAAGMSGISLVSLLLTQVDKIILSKLLTLEMFGYYTLAVVVAMNLYRIIGPIFSAIYPSLTQLVTSGKQEELKHLYHHSCQFMSVLILPVACVLCFFSYDILLLWTQNPVTAEKTHLLVSILVTGTALNGLMNIPYALQLAYGWTSLAFYVNVIAVFFLVPLIIFMTTYYGAIGAASGWVILNSGYVLFTIQVMHRRLLPGEKWRWYREDVGLPFITALITAGLGRIVFSEPMTQPMMLIALISSYVITLGITSYVTTITREWLNNKIADLKVIYESSRY
jgi:O-antigen/teichoic acid export membrane protein